MIEVLSKPANQISPDDIKTLIASKVLEGEQIEFKVTLPARNQQDPWITSEDRIGDYAKNAILREVVAFANAYGGVLLLGVKESDTSPPTAAGVSPIPRCADLAERLTLVFRDRVEPQLTRLEVFAVPIEGDSGVIVMRTGRSRRAPHRITGIRVCPIRRSDRCEEMTMREIQDMTLNLSRGLEQLERRLLERTECFQREFTRLQTPEDAFGFRLTAMPVGDEVGFDTVFHYGGLPEELRKPAIKVIRRIKGFNSPLHSLHDYHDLHPSDWQPRLRATRAVDSHGGNEIIRYTYYEIHCDGLIEMGFVSNRSITPPSDKMQNSLIAEVPVSMFASLIVWADHIRKQAQAPMAEYAIEVEIRVVGGRCASNALC